MNLLISPQAVSSALSAGLLAHQTILGGWFGDDDLLEAPPAAEQVDHPALIAVPLSQIAECRGLAIALRQSRSGLRGWDRTLVREITRWRREPSAYEAQEVAVLAERIFWNNRDEATA